MIPVNCVLVMGSLNVDSEPVNLSNRGRIVHEPFLVGVGDNDLTALKGNSFSVSFPMPEQ